MSTLTHLAGESVETIRTQLDPMLAAAGWRISFADGEFRQWAAPCAPKIAPSNSPFARPSIPRVTHHSYPFLVPTIDYFSGDPRQLELTDFGGRVERVTTVEELAMWLERLARDSRISDARAIVAAKGRRRGGVGRRENIHK
jgi:hypothetical protein